jgi:hypothetical protein
LSPERLYLRITIIIIVYTQTLTGLTLDEASETNFSEAVFRSVSVAVGVAKDDVSGNVSADRELVVGADGAETSNINTVYDLGVVTNLTSPQSISKLQAAVDSGAFLKSLRSFSGLNITSMTNTRFNDETPTGSPSVAPTTIADAQAANRGAEHLHTYI